SKQTNLDFSGGQQHATQSELNRLIARHVVESMLPLSTVESESFRALVAKIPPPCRKTFTKYIDDQYTKMNMELKKPFAEFEHVSTTADIWTAHSKSCLGVTVHWINPHSMEQGKAALACRRFRGPHTHDNIALELDNIHSSYERDSDEDDEDEVTFLNINDILRTSDDNDGRDVVITLPPHQRCASHILNLDSCKCYYKMYRVVQSRSTLAAETVDDVISKKLLVPCTTRWNSFIHALARISEISVVELNTISYNFGLTAITEREHQFIREYCPVMRPLTVALDILQREDNCFPGTLLPMLVTLMLKTLERKSGLQILVDLPDAIKSRFADVLDSKDAILAAVTLPKLKLRWLRSQELKDKAKASLLAELFYLDENQQPGTSKSTRHLSSTEAKEDEFFFFEEDEGDTSATAEGQVTDYFKSGAQAINSLNGFPLIKKISIRFNAATPSSAPVERLFSLGKLFEVQGSVHDHGPKLHQQHHQEGLGNLVFRQRLRDVSCRRVFLNTHTFVLIRNTSTKHSTLLSL
uniref:HAT C-terminal dimerisation domain-containing protein n=1 Tax=Periophthalmus magnuspinnatus TaxID=409849 RepID=A0A3B4ALI7_9GOBI